jgi:hypothetical protein
MKIISLKSLAFTTIVCASLSISLPVFANDGGGADDGEQGGDISGGESLHQKVILTATPDAPLGTVGKVELEADNEEGTATAFLKLELSGLVDGTYSVSITKKSDGATVDLGTFDYAAVGSTVGESDDDSLISKRGASDSQDEPEVEVEFGDTGITLPPDLNPLDIATIAIADSSAIVLLTGDFTAVDGTSLSFINAHIRITAGAGAPSANGTAHLIAKAKGGKVKNKNFSMLAKHVPANSIFSLSVNGVDVGTVSSNAQGKLLIKKLNNVNPFTVHSVKVHSGSTSIVEANF